jgi:hypothetical protein
VNSNVNFNSHALGALSGGFYSASDGVTLSASGILTTVSFGNGPGDGNNVSAPLSPGEGLHAASNYLGPAGPFSTNTLTSTLTIDFVSPVLGVGIASIDLWDPESPTLLTIEAFTGPGGTGTSLGLFSNAVFNFQNNNTYFMGVTSTAGDIRSLVVTHVPGGGDRIGIDDIVFATATVPEPATHALIGLALAAFGLARRRHSWRRSLVE